MTMKKLLLGAVMTGALMVPAIAMAADAAAPAPAETAKEAPKEAAPAPAATPAPAAGEDHATKMFESFDADKNGSINEDEFLNHRKETKGETKMSPEEIAAKKKERFKEIDTNADGKIDRAEFDAYGEKLKARRMEHKADMEKKADAPAAAPKEEAPKADETKTEAPKEAPAH